MGAPPNSPSDPGTSPQLSLFALGAPTHPPKDAPPPSLPAPNAVWGALGRELAARFPEVRFGTSSWTFPGWSGIVYAEGTSAKSLNHDGLGAYAAHPLFRTVGIDRSFYNVLTAEEIARYAAQVHAVEAQELPSFRPLAKVLRTITTAFPSSHTLVVSSPRSAGSESFLDPQAFLASIAPWKAAPAFAPIHVLEFSPMPLGAMTAGAFADALERFFGALPNDLALAVELRNEHLFSPKYAAVVRERRIAHVYNEWTAMPSVGTQARRFLPRPEVPLIVRLLLPRNSQYADKKAEFAPFQRIGKVEPQMRADTIALIHAARARGVKEIFVTVNNKAEGCSPLTVEALARLLLETDMTQQANAQGHDP